MSYRNRIGRTLIVPALALFLALALARADTATASTFIRSGLEELAQSNQRIVVGQVVDAVSYWNSDRSFILTDVIVAADETIKGAAEKTVTLTLMGGTVGDTSVLIAGGADLLPGRSYLLFLAANDLPGAARVLSVRDHCQGAFEILAVAGRLRAVSQASRQALLPDGNGLREAPGGSQGFELETLIESLRRTVRQADTGEVAP